MNIFSQIIEKVDESLVQTLQGMVSNLISAISPLVLTAVAIYVALQGYLLLRGAISEPIMDITYKIIKISAIVFFALNSGAYLNLVVNTVTDGAEEFVSAISGRSGSFADQLDSFMGQKRVLVEAIEAKYNSWMSGIGHAIYRVVLTVFVAVIFTFCGALLVLNWLVASILLSILLILGPFFIACLIFEQTKSLFFSWLGQVLSNVILLILSGILGHLITTFIADEIAKMNPQDVLDISTLFVIFILPIIVCFIYYKFLGSVASAIGGGFTVTGSGILGKAGRLAGKGASKTGGMALNKFRNMRQAKQIDTLTK